MHVVLLNQYYAPAEAATAQLLADVGESLVLAGHRVSVICSRRSYPDPSAVYPAREEIGGVSVYRTWTSGFGRGSRLGRLADYALFLAGASRMLALQREVDVVVSLTTPPMLDTLGLAAARLRRARSVSWVMDVYPELAFELGILARRSVVGRLLGCVSRSTLRRTDVAIALGPTMARRLRECGATRIHTVPVAGHALRAAWGWGNRFVVLYSGNLGLAHDFDTILDAAELLRGGPDVRFAFVGAGPRRDAVQAEVRRRGLQNVEFRPHVERPQLGQSLTAGDLHLVTLREGVAGLVVPSKIYGILAAGRPTLYVGPDEGEVAEILEEGRCGTRIAPGDAAGLATAIRDYVADEGRCSDEGARARELFDRRFARERALGTLQGLFESLAEEPS